MDLEQRLEQQIQSRTFHRVRDLRVELRDDHVVVHGWTSSYYLVQMVVLAVRDVVPTTTPVQLDIQVGSGELSHRGLVGV
jgi:hypothetical protein